MKLYMFWSTEKVNVRSRRWLSGRACTSRRAIVERLLVQIPPSPPAGPSRNRCAPICLETESNLAPYMVVLPFRHVISQCKSLVDFNILKKKKLIFHSQWHYIIFLVSLQFLEMVLDTGVWLFSRHDHYSNNCDVISYTRYYKPDEANHNDNDTNFLSFMFCRHFYNLLSRWCCVL